MPDFVVAEVGWEGVWFAESKADRAERKTQASDDHQDDRLYGQYLHNASCKGQNQPAKQQVTEIREPDRKLGEEDRFDDDEEDCEAPDDAE
jgi:hypothetical protein